MAVVTLNLPAANALADAAASRGLQTALLQGERILKGDILSRPGTGRSYPRGKDRVHVASAPGEPPAPDTGNLRARTQADTDLRHDGDDLTGRVVANVDYAEALEVGTERMAARPFLRTLARDHAEPLTRAFQAGARG